MSVGITLRLETLHKEFRVSGTPVRAVDGASDPTALAHGGRPGLHVRAWPTLPFRASPPSTINS